MRPVRSSAGRRPCLSDQASPEERGETLVELLVTIVILGASVIVLVSGLMVAVRLSATDREVTAADVALRGWGESLAKASDGDYGDCSTTAAQLAAAFPPPVVSGVSLTIEPGITYWQPPTGTAVAGSFAATCAGPGATLRQLTLTATSTDGDPSLPRSLTVVMRKPCDATAC